jgi:DNA-directed RNA polymerase specialized sigma24 family protein
MRRFEPGRGRGCGMNGYVEWIGAQAEDPDADDALKSREAFEPEDGQSHDEHARPPWQELPVHNFPASMHVPTEAQLEDDPLDRNPDLWMYRSRTVSLLRRYLRFSLETGRLPSFVGREFFRAKMTCYTAVTFEDRVIFVRDVEKSLDRMEYWDQQLIARIIFEEHSQERAARIMHWGLRTIERRLPRALDLLSEDFLRVGLLAAMPSKGSSSR